MRLETLDELKGQAFVDFKCRLAELERAMVECAQLASVFDETRSGRKTRLGEGLHPRVILAHGVIDAMEIRLMLRGDHVKLVRDGEAYVTVGVAKELRKLRLDGCQEQILRTDDREQRGRPLCGSWRDAA